MRRFDRSRWRSRIEQTLRNGSSARNVLTLLSGTATAQLLAVLLLFPVAWLYSPSDLGLFALFQSVVVLGVTVASSRYDLAVVLPQTDLEARVLLRLARVSITIVSLVVAVACLLLHGSFYAWFGSAALADWLYLSAGVVFLMAQIASTQLWLTRAKDFRRIAANRVLAGVAVGLCQIVAYFFLPDIRGLILGLGLGQLVAAVVIIIRTPSARLTIPSEAPSMRSLAKRYRKMPLLNGPNAIVDSARTMGINVLIGNIALAGLGQYNLAWQLTMAPASLVQGSIAQVLLQRMSVARPGSLTPLVKRLLFRIGVVSVPAFGLYYWLAPSMFELFLGSEWSDSGLFARGLIPWVFMLTFTSPLSNIFIVTERQQWMLVFAVIYATCPLVLLSVGSTDLVTVVQSLGWLMGGLLVGLVVLALVVATRFDGSGATGVTSEAGAPGSAE